jgi:hypothetical protein
MLVTATDRKPARVVTGGSIRSEHRSISDDASTLPTPIRAIAGDFRIERSADPDGGCALEHNVRHPSSRFDMKAKRNHQNPLQRVDHARGRQHHVRDEMNFCLAAFEEPFHLGAKPVDPFGTP